MGRLRIFDKLGTQMIIDLVFYTGHIIYAHNVIFPRIMVVYACCFVFLKNHQNRFEMSRNLLFHFKNPPTKIPKNETSNRHSKPGQVRLSVHIHQTKQRINGGRRKRSTWEVNSKDGEYFAFRILSMATKIQGSVMASMV